MKTLITIGLTLSLASLTTGITQQVHQHGQAQLHVVIDTQQISVELTAPAMSIVGFERSATTKAEKAQLAKAKETLRQPSLFSFYKKKGYFRRPTAIPASLVMANVAILEDDDLFDRENNHEDPDTHDDHHHDHDQDKHESTHDEEDPHVEFKLKAQYQKKASDTITALSTELFTHFKALEQINVTVITEDQQSFYKLSPKQVRLSLLSASKR